jgi:hypothetical protein
MAAAILDITQAKVSNKHIHVVVTQAKVSTILDITQAKSNC